MAQYESNLKRGKSFVAIYKTIAVHPKPDLIAKHSCKNIKTDEGNQALTYPSYDFG